MAVLLLRGDFSFPGGDAFATNGFEALDEGTVRDLTPGLQVGGDCDWGTTILRQR